MEEEVYYIHPVSLVFVCVPAVATRRRARGRSPSHTVKLMQLRCASLYDFPARRRTRRASHTTTITTRERHDTGYGDRKKLQMYLHAHTYQEPNLSRSCSATHLTLRPSPSLHCGLLFTDPHREKREGEGHVAETGQGQVIVVPNSRARILINIQTRQENAFKCIPRNMKRREKIRILIIPMSMKLQHPP